MANGELQAQVDIPDYIDDDFREYAMYSIESRGIPSFYDGLINVQRIILSSVPSEYAPTSTVIGEGYKNGYHHGDAALAKSISNLAREYRNSTPLVDGNGFFGNSMKGPAAARYTKVRSNKVVRELIGKYKPINEEDEYGVPKYFHLDLPIGLLLNINGIATGYACNILPRKLEDIQKYLDGKYTKLVPDLGGFKGTIESAGRNKWLVSSKIEVDKYSITIEDMPPFMTTYTTFLEKLSKVVEEFPHRATLYNMTKTYPIMKISYGRIPDEKREELLEQVKKVCSVTVSENIVMTNEHGIVAYDDIKQYLRDYRIHLNSVKLKHMKYELGQQRKKLSLTLATVNFIKFMMGASWDREVVMGWLARYDDDEYIKSRLMDYRAYNINTTNLEQLESQVPGLENDIRSLEVDISEFEETADFTIGFNGQIKFR